MTSSPATAFNNAPAPSLLKAAPTTTNALPADRPVPRLRQFAYGLGDFGSNFSWTFVASFVMFYLTTIVGLSSAALGTLMLIARLLDGITDIIIGGLIDKTRSRMGKARPWLFWSTFPLAASQIMLFNVPTALTGTGRYVWFFISYLLLGAFFYTASNISYNALISLATRHQNSRVSMGSLRFICAIAAGMFVGSATPSIVTALGGGARGWSIITIIYSLIFVVFTLITVFGVRERVTEEERSHQEFQASLGLPDGGNNQRTNSDSSYSHVNTHESGEATLAAPTDFFHSLALLLHNRYFLIMAALFLINYISAGVGQTVAVYYATYVLGSANYMLILGSLTMLPTIAALAITPFFTSRYGMRNTCLVGAIIALTGSVIAYLGSSSLPILVIGLSLAAAGSGPFMSTMYAFVAATAEYSALKDHVKMEGVVYSCSSVGLKLGTGLGTALVGWVLAAGGFVNDAPTQSTGAVTAISILYLLVPLVLAALRVPLLWILDVEKRNAQLREAQ